MALFEGNGWGGAWRNGIYVHHHHHSAAHELLGIAAGSVRVRLGGAGGKTVELGGGDVVVIRPALLTGARERVRIWWSSVPIRTGRARICAHPARPITSTPQRGLPRFRCPSATRSTAHRRHCSSAGALPHAADETPVGVG